MKIRDIKDGEKFTIPGHKGIWSIQRVNEYDATIYNEEGEGFLASSWDMEVEPVEIKQ